MQLFTNNANSTLAAGITDVATSLTLATGKGALFPSPTGGDFFMLTLTQAEAETSWEVVKVTARTGDALTIVRAQEGTTGAAWGTGSKAELRVTAEALNGKQPTLVSGTNIKTINGTSILGSGNLTIEGGGSSAGGFEQTFMLMGA